MKTYIFANWKMNPVTLKEAKEIFDYVEKYLKENKKKDIEVVVFPPFIYISNFNIENSGLKIGAQNVFYEEKGAYTGEISPLMLKDAGCQYVIVGHSERRKYFAETDDIVNKKLKAVLETGITPVLCIGETEEQRESGKTEEIIESQLKNSLKDISSSKFQSSGIIIAYEPVWAIGTGNACGTEEAGKARIFIKNTLAGIYSLKTAEETAVIYGGSVNSKNSADYIEKAGFSGLLVGGASLNSEEFIKIVNSVV